MTQSNMTKPRISIIVALSETTRAIGKDNDLLWKIPEDLKRFKSLTMGHPIIMGRKTFESIGRPLPGRTNIIVTRNKGYVVPGATIVSSIEEAIAYAKNIDIQELFVIGGQEIYTLALPYTDRLYLTLIQSDLQGDVFFPDYSEFTKQILTEKHLTNTPPYTFAVLEKK